MEEDQCRDRKNEQKNKWTGEKRRKMNRTRYKDGKVYR